MGALPSSHGRVSRNFSCLDKPQRLLAALLHLHCIGSALRHLQWARALVHVSLQRADSWLEGEQIAHLVVFLFAYSPKNQHRVRSRSTGIGWGCGDWSALSELAEGCCRRALTARRLCLRASSACHSTSGRKCWQAWASVSCGSTGWSWACSRASTCTVSRTGRCTRSASRVWTIPRYATCCICARASSCSATAAIDCLILRSRFLQLFLLAAVCFKADSCFAGARRAEETAKRAAASGGRFSANCWKRPVSRRLGLRQEEEKRQQQEADSVHQRVRLHRSEQSMVRRMMMHDSLVLFLTHILFSATFVGDRRACFPPTSWPSCLDSTERSK